MSDQPQPHPVVVRYHTARERFTPEITPQELQQMQELAEANPDLSNDDLSVKINEEFGLQARFDAFQKHDSDADEMTKDFAAIIKKWKIVEMVDPLLIAGSVLHHLSGLSAVMGGYIEDLYTRSGGDNPAPDNAVPSSDPVQN